MYDQQRHATPPLPPQSRTVETGRHLRSVGAVQRHDRRQLMQRIAVGRPRGATPVGSATPQASARPGYSMSAEQQVHTGTRRMFDPPMQHHPRATVKHQSTPNSIKPRPT